MKKRICYIEISTPSGDKQIKNIGLKGSVHRRMGSVAADANISVANLAKEDIEYLSTYMTTYVDPEKQKKINVYAGYEDTGYGLIFQGDIIEAKPEGLPDIWLNIKAKTNYFNRQNIITYSTTSPVSAKQMGQNIANQLDVPLSWKSRSQKLIDSFNFAGAKAKLIEEFNKYGDFVAFMDNGILKVIDKDDEPPKEESSDLSTSGTKLINLSSGLIGIPQPTEYGCKFKTLLDPTLNPGDWVKLESEKIPAVNGFYQIYDLNFNFSTIELDFYAEIEGKNFQRIRK